MWGPYKELVEIGTREGFRGLLESNAITVKATDVCLDVDVDLNLVDVFKFNFRFTLNVVTGKSFIVKNRQVT